MPFSSEYLVTFIISFITIYFIHFALLIYIALSIKKLVRKVSSIDDSEPEFIRCVSKEIDTDTLVRIFAPRGLSIPPTRFKGTFIRIYSEHGDDTSIDTLRISFGRQRLNGSSLLLSDAIQNGMISQEEVRYLITNAIIHYCKHSRWDFQEW